MPVLEGGSERNTTKCFSFSKNIYNLFIITGKIYLELETFKEKTKEILTIQT